jgi:Myb-like DNA-binding domain
MPLREIESDNDELKKGSFEQKARTRGHWTPVEDEKLKRLVAQHGGQNWNLLADKLEGRTGNNEKKNNLILKYFLIFRTILKRFWRFFIIREEL